MTTTTTEAFETGLSAEFEAWKRTQIDRDAWSAVLWATERAAKLCDEQGDFYMQQAREGDQSGASDHKACAAVECADAIRSSR